MGVGNYRLRMVCVRAVLRNRFCVSVKDEEGRRIHLWISKEPVIRRNIGEHHGSWQCQKSIQGKGRDIDIELGPINDIMNVFAIMEGRLSNSCLCDVGNKKEVYGSVIFLAMTDG
jgi:hypothetical protein